MENQELEQVLAALTQSPPTGISIAARMALTAHSLNNEGSRTNALIPRQVDVIQGDEIVQVNAISGDSVKHTFVDHLRRIAEDTQARGLTDALPLCSACARSDPNRLNGDPDFQQFARKGSKEVSDADIIERLIQSCVIDDVAGLLVTQGNRNAPRRSTAQFGWTIGLPDQVRTGRYMHLKLVPGAALAESEDGSNLGQNLFTRPASSGDYAFVGQADLARIGINDITWSRAVPEETQRARQAATLEALYLTIATLEGAQRNTQLPHVTAAYGAVSVSISSLAPVLFSPLAEDFVDQMRDISAAFGRLGRELFVVPFGTAGELGQILSALADTVRPPELAPAD